MDGDAKAFAAMDMTFSTPSASGQEVHLSNRYRRVTAENRAEYTRLALHYRLHEFDPAVAAVREGIARYCTTLYTSSILFCTTTGWCRCLCSPCSPAPSWRPWSAAARTSLSTCLDLSLPTRSVQQLVSIGRSLVS